MGSPRSSSRAGAKRRRVVAAAGCAVALSWLSRPVARARVSATSRDSAELISVTIALLPSSQRRKPSTPRHRGFFGRQGIDAKIQVLSDPSQILAALLSGDVQFSGFNTGGLATLKSRGAPVRLIAAGALYRPTAPTTALVAAPGRRSPAPGTSSVSASRSTRRTPSRISAC